MVAELLLEAFNLMVIGMVAVFAFLLLLVFVVVLISKTIQRYFPVQIAEKPALTERQSGTPPAVIAAISAAVHQYRNQH